MAEVNFVLYVHIPFCVIDVCCIVETRLNLSSIVHNWIVLNTTSNGDTSVIINTRTV